MKLIIILDALKINLIRLGWRSYVLGLSIGRSLASISVSMRFINGVLVKLEVVFQLGSLFFFLIGDDTYVLCYSLVAF